MANLKDIKRRITSVKNTQKITHAMKLVSAAKYARANAAVNRGRPYSKGLSGMVGRLAAACGSEIESNLLQEGPNKKILVILLGTDKGLCGGLNNNLFKRVVAWLQDQKAEGFDADLWAWGRRSILFSDKLGLTIDDEKQKVLDPPRYEFASESARELVKRFNNGQYHSVYLAYNTFESVLSQIPTIERLLPFELTADEGGGGPGDYIVEPPLAQIADPLFLRGLASKLYQSFLEGAASEHGARMTAMDSATNNAKEVIRKLTLEYNRGRQAAITKELIEIVSGAEAL